MNEREVISKQIDSLLHEITSIEHFKKKEINFLLPVDCSKDVVKVIGPLLKELKVFVEDEEYDSYIFGHFLTEKFEVALELEINFPDEILAKTLNLFYTMLIEIKNLTYSLKKYLSDILISLLKKSKKIDKSLFKADWKPIFKLVDFFYYPKSEDYSVLHAYQSSTCSVFIELAKYLRRFYSVECANEILEEFEGDLIIFHSKEALRAVRFMSLLIPFEGLSLEQIERIFGILKDKVGKLKRISTQFDIFIVFMLKKLTKYNAETLKKYNWDDLSCFVFEQILPGALKIPSPVKGSRKISKLISKSDISFGEEFFETLGNNVPLRIAKWIVYTMQTDFYSLAIHDKLMFFLENLRSLCHPSNYGQWNVPIEIFLGYFAGTLANQKNTNELWLKAVDEDLVSAVVEKVWNLSELLVFARSGNALSGMCISSFTCLNLANVRSEIIIPKMMIAISGALESNSEPHRTISAIGLLQVTMSNLLKSSIGIVSVLSLLPTVVFGIDSNDQLKSIRTLSMFLSFSEAARIEDISGESFDSLEDWSDSFQEAKELTGQFSDIFLLFTENVISYLRTISQETSNDHDDLSRMILAISNCIYARISDKIADICLEKWLELIDEDLGKMVTEVVGEIISKIAKHHNCVSLVKKLISKLFSQIFQQIERGDGQLGSKDQSNNSLNNNLTVLSHLLENSKEYLKSNLSELNESIIKIMSLVTNRKSFLAASRLFHSITIGLIHHEIKELKIKESKSNPFSSWSRWMKIEDVVEGKDFEFNLATESDGLLALNSIEKVLIWTRENVSCLKIVNSTSLLKGESEKIFCLLNVIENLNIDLLSVYNSFSSYNYEINEELNCDLVAKKTLELIKENLNVLKSLFLIIEISGNLELEIKVIELIGAIITGTPISPDKSREKLKAIKRLNISYDRYHDDKDRPVSFWILKAEAQFKLRRDLRFYLGDSKFELEMISEFDEFEKILFKYCFKPYHMLRISAQTILGIFAQKYINKSRDYIQKILDIVERNENLSESEFKGVCFMLRNRFADMICEDFGLVCRFLRVLLKLSEMLVAQEVNESFDLINGTLNVLSDAYVPDIRDDKEKVKHLVMELIAFAEGKSEKWTSQYLAMLSAHPMIEMCDTSEIFGKLAKFSLSKVAIIRNVAQNCFKQAIYGYLKNNNVINLSDCEQYWKFKDLTALKMERTGKFAEYPKICLKAWTVGEFQDFCEFAREYLKYLCLPTDDDEGSGGEGVQFEYMNFAYLGRWISLFGEGEMIKFMEIIDSIFSKKESLDLGHQRALCEVICAIICNSNSKSFTENLKNLLRKSWNELAIENLGLWTSAINEPLMWNEFILKQVFEFFEASTSAGNETSRIILGFKMISIIYSKFEGEIKCFNQQVLIEKLVDLCSHEYTSIVMESSKLLALISMKNESFVRDEIILSKLFENENLQKSDSLSRAILQFFACSSTLPAFTEFWTIFALKLEDILKILQSEKVQMLTDAKKALLTLFLTKGANLNDLNNLARVTLKYSSESNVPVKISKFCIELVQLLVQNNFGLFHQNGSVEDFFKSHVDFLIESDQLHLRESSHGIILSLYQIDSKKSMKDAEIVTKKLQKLKVGIKSDLGVKERHGNVLRASGMILSEPFGLSKSLPALLTALSFFISDRSPISPLVRLTFNEFRRTHQDTWNSDRQLFDEDQLDAIGELLIAPSYYA